MFVYDYVIYYGETIMEFRLKYLNNYVDRFIIVELGRMTSKRKASEISPCESF